MHRLQSHRPTGANIVVNLTGLIELSFNEDSNRLPWDSSQSAQLDRLQLARVDQHEDECPPTLQLLGDTLNVQEFCRSGALIISHRESSRRDGPKGDTLPQTGAMLWKLEQIQSCRDAPADMCG